MTLTITSIAPLYEEGTPASVLAKDLQVGDQLWAFSEIFKYEIWRRIRRVVKTGPYVLVAYDYRRDEMLFLPDDVCQILPGPARLSPS